MEKMATKHYSLKKMLTIISLILLELLHDASAADKNVKRLQNIFCGKPHATVVALDANYGYFPFFVKLHRCAGSAHFSPSLRHCVPSSYEELNIEVHTQESNFRKTKIITVKNHTSCTHECVASADDCDFSVEDWDDDRCRCKCRYPDGPPKELACKAGFRWNKHMCRCECARAPDHCPLRMVWSKEICGCRCQDSVVNECTRAKMGIDVDCKCVNTLAIAHKPGADPHYRMFITLLVGQAALIIILICALVHWVRKRNRENSTHSPFNRSDSNKTDDDINLPYLEVAVESGSTDTLGGTTKYPYGDDVSCTAPLSPKDRETDI